MFAFGTYYLNGVNDYFEVMSGAIRPAERTGVTQFVGQTVYGLASFIMLFAVPLLSMRLDFRRAPQPNTAIFIQCAVVADRNCVG